MTDNDIIKSAECCLQTKTKDDCAKIGCPSYYENGCHLYDTVDDDYYALFYHFTAELLKIANRQKAELEKLQCSYDCELAYRKELHKRAKAEAFKEFAEKLKIKCTPENPWEDFFVCESDIDELLEEMVGESE